MSADYLSVDGPQAADASAHQGPCVPSQPDADLLGHQPPLTYTSARSQALAKEVRTADTLHVEQGAPAACSPVIKGHRNAWINYNTLKGFFHFCN